MKKSLSNRGGLWNSNPTSGKIRNLLHASEKYRVSDYGFRILIQRL